jgi:hypothetical protein
MGGGSGAQTAGRFRIDAVLSVPTDLRQNNPVDVARTLRRNQAVFCVAGDQVRLAFEGVTVSAAGEEYVAARSYARARDAN